MSSIIFLPLGSYEQHGKILPHDTDTVICEYICNHVATHFVGSTVLPSVTYGLSQEHMGIGKTITFSIDTYIGLIQDIFSCIPEAFPECKLIVLINGHGGNQNILSAICSQNNYKGIFPKAMVEHVFPKSTRDLAVELLGNFNAHADSVETSVYASISKNMEDGVCSLSSLGEISIPKHKFRFFPTRDISIHGIVTSESEIIINKDIGQKLICNSIESISYEINEAMRMIEENKYGIQFLSNEK